jgi:nitrogen fixation protein FixH
MQHMKQREFTGKHMLLVVFLFFGTIITVNMIMAYNATRSWTGLVVKNSYVESQKFNDYLAAEAAQDALGWQPSVAYEDGVLRYRLADKDGSPIMIEYAEVQLRRPSHEREDQLLTLYPNGDVYEARYELGYGAWDVFVTTKDETGTPYVHRERILVQ